MLAEYGVIDDARKKAVLLTAIGDEAHTAITNFAETEKNTYPHLVAKLKEYYEPHVNDFVERHTFYNLFQEENELVDDFVNRLKTQALKCNFKVLCAPAVEAQAGPPVVAAREAVYHDITDEFIRDRLVIGLFDQSTRRRIMREKTLTLESAIEIVRATEMANKQLQKLVTSQQLRHVHSCLL